MSTIGAIMDIDKYYRFLDKSKNIKSYNKIELHGFLSYSVEIVDGITTIRCGKINTISSLFFLSNEMEYYGTNVIMTSPNRMLIKFTQENEIKFNTGNISEMFYSTEEYFQFSTTATENEILGYDVLLRYRLYNIPSILMFSNANINYSILDDMIDKAMEDMDL